MGFLSFFHAPDINAGVADCQADPGAVLLDVRTAEEFRQGHIEGSVNLPLDRLSAIGGTVPDKGTPLYVYCLSGGRSSRAVSLLKQAGYTTVTNLGGISAYRGRIVK